MALLDGAAGRRQVAGHGIRIDFDRRSARELHRPGDPDPPANAGPVEARDDRDVHGGSCFREVPQIGSGAVGRGADGVARQVALGFTEGVLVLVQEQVVLDFLPTDLLLKEGVEHDGTNPRVGEGTNPWDGLRQR